MLKHPPAVFDEGVGVGKNGIPDGGLPEMGEDDFARTFANIFYGFLPGFAL